MNSCYMFKSIDVVPCSSVGLLPRPAFSDPSEDPCSKLRVAMALVEFQMGFRDGAKSARSFEGAAQVGALEAIARGRPNRIHEQSPVDGATVGHRHVVQEVTQARGRSQASCGDCWCCGDRRKLAVWRRGEQCRPRRNRFNLHRASPSLKASSDTGLQVQGHAGKRLRESIPTWRAPGVRGEHDERSKVAAVRGNPGLSEAALQHDASLVEGRRRDIRKASATPQQAPRRLGQEGKDVPEHWGGAMDLLHPRPRALCQVRGSDEHRVQPQQPSGGREIRQETGEGRKLLGDALIGDPRVCQKTIQEAALGSRSGKRRMPQHHELAPLRDTDVAVISV
mmetsp:Transcript_77029/g.214219  ORF Transcript_77029/g.214219 Transcript_77029/m.214219 type:complete len:337 (-) Transcript_77029:861-1871(-)